MKVGEKKSPYTGAWNVVLEDANETSYALECLVPGRPDTLAGAAGVTGDWSQNQYLLSMEKDFEEGGRFRTLPISPEEAREIRTVLQEVRDGKRSMTNVYDTDVPRERVDEVVGFLEPRVEIAARHYIEGRTIAPYNAIELNLHPPLPDSVLVPLT